MNFHSIPLAIIGALAAGPALAQGEVNVYTYREPS